MRSRIFTDREKWYKLIPIVLIVIITLIFILTFDIEDLRQFLQKYEKPGLMICLLVYVFLGITFIPSDPVTLIVLAWKGPLIAIILSALGNTLAGMIEYAIGGNISDLADFEKGKEKLPFHLGRLPINSPIFLLLARAVPGFGPKFVNIAGGVYNVPLITYMWTSVVANLVGAVIVVLAGTGLIALIK